MSGGAAEIYLAPVLAYVMYGDLTFSASGDTIRIAVDND
jgi:hypothetical protein